jgi:NADH-quinone oxidoreductase subunit G
MAAADMEKAAAVLLVGCNIRHEMPLLHQRLLKASKRGARIFSISPVDFEFTFGVTASKLVAPSQLAATLEQGGDFAEALRAGNGNAVIVLGELAENHPQAARIRAAARALAQGTGAKLNRIPQGANAIGLSAAGVLPGAGGRDAGAMLSSESSGFLLFGVDPQHDFADNAQAARAMAGKPVVAFSAYASETLKALADLILPIGLLPEIEGTLSNVDNLAQLAAPGSRLPGDARPGWRVLRALADALDLPGLAFTDIAGLRTTLAPKPVRPAARAAAAAAEAKPDTLERIAPTAIYRADAVLRRAAALNAHPLTSGARVLLHPADAAARNLAEGAMAKLSDGNGTATLPVALSARVARGCALVERGYDASAPLSPSANLDVRGA